MLTIALTLSKNHVGHFCLGEGKQSPEFKDLVFLPALPFLLNLLLLLQLLRHAGFSQSLALAPFVSFGVQSRLQGGIPTHAGHHLLSQLSRGEQLDSLPNRGQLLSPDRLSFPFNGTEQEWRGSLPTSFPVTLGLLLNEGTQMKSDLHGIFKDGINFLSNDSHQKQL
jgi:hypothetical protein